MYYAIQDTTANNKGGSIMIEYLLKIKSITDALASAWHVISVEDQILHVLVGLGSEYDSFIASISLGFELCCTQDIVALLLAHDKRLENTTF